MEIADITIVPVASDRRAAYLEFSKRMAAVYCDHGAIRVVDYWQLGGSADRADFHAEGASYESGELEGIGNLIGAGSTESTVVTVTTWPSREVRDRATLAVGKDPRVFATLNEDPVFDGRQVAGETFEIALITRGRRLTPRRWDARPHAGVTLILYEGVSDHLQTLVMVIRPGRLVARVG